MSEFVPRTSTNSHLPPIHFQHSTSNFQHSPNRGSGVGLGTFGEDATGENNTFAADARMGPDVAPELISACGHEGTLVGHANLAGIVAEVAKDAPATHVDVVLKHGVANISEVRNKHAVAQDAALNFHSIANDAAIANAHLATDVGIGANGAIFADAHMPLYHGAGFDNGAFAQL